MLSPCTKVIRTPGWTVCVALRGLLLVVSIMKYLLKPAAKGLQGHDKLL